MPVASRTRRLGDDARRLDRANNPANTTRWLANVDFMIYPIEGTSWNDVPGVYIFAGQQWPGGHWYPVYVGQADSFADCLPDHERREEALLVGATALHVRETWSEAEREDLKRQLIERYQPELNILYRGAPQ